MPSTILMQFPGVRKFVEGKRKASSQDASHRHPLADIGGVIVVLFGVAASYGSLSPRFVYFLVADTRRYSNPGRKTKWSSRLGIFLRELDRIAGGSSSINLGSFQEDVKEKKVPRRRRKAIGGHGRVRLSRLSTSNPFGHAAYAIIVLSTGILAIKNSLQIIPKCSLVQG